MNMVHAQMREVLAETIHILFPLTENPYDIIQQHVWRNRKYVGENSNGVVAWKGFSANLNRMSYKYQTIYINRVQNVLPTEDCENLFGAEFTESISKMSEYVVVYTTGFNELHIKAIHQQGYIARKVGEKLHAAIVLEPKIFVQGTPKHWASDLTRMANFARQLKFKLTDNIESPAATYVIEHWDDDLNLLY